MRTARGGELESRGGATSTVAARLRHPWLPVALFAVALAAIMFRHEMWRDELQAWMLVCDAASPLDLPGKIRYEGHPGLWYFILWPVSRVSAHPAAMQVVHWLIGVATAFVILRRAPFSRVVRGLLVASYFFAYEWAAISRNYGISALLLFLVCSMWRERWRHFAWIGALLFALCHTNAHSILVVGALLPCLGVEFAVSFARRFRKAHAYLPRVLLGFALVAAGLYTGVRQVLPPPDSGYATEWHLTWSDERAQETAATLVNAYAPVPAKSKWIWNKNRFHQIRPEADEAIQIFLEPEQRIQAGLWILALGCLFFVRRPWLIVLYLSTSGALLVFFYVKYVGDWRHHGFLFLVFIALLWMSYAYEPWRLRWRPLERLLSFVDGQRANLLVPLLLLHVWGSALAIRADWGRPFSRAQQTAAWISSEFEGRADVFVAGDKGPAVSAVCAYLDQPAFYLGRGEFGTYMIWDRHWRSRSPEEMKAALVAQVRESGRSAILVLSWAPPAAFLPEGTKHLKSFAGSLVGTESFEVFFVPLIER